MSQLVVGQNAAFHPIVHCLEAPIEPPGDFALADETFQICRFHVFGVAT
jgi:hypothetical protein